MALNQQDKHVKQGPLTDKTGEAMATAKAHLTVLLILNWLCLAEAAFIITGSTGVLGRRLVSACLSKRKVIVGLGYRDEGKLSELLASHSSDGRLLPFFLDLAKAENEVVFKTEEFFPKLLARMEGRDRNIVLINNAGVFLQGSSVQAMKNSLSINAIKPAKLAICLNDLVTKHNKSKSSDSQISLTIVNISSGDGEVVYLSPAIQAQVSNLDTFNQWTWYLEYLLTTYNPQVEYGFGETPMYSLSKALLNSFTRIFHTKCAGQCRVLAVCPGDFESPMTTAAERGAAADIDAVADLIVDMASNKNVQGGKFYRGGVEIQM